MPWWAFALASAVAAAATIALAALLLGESVSWKLALGAALMVIGALLTLAA